MSFKQDLRKPAYWVHIGIIVLVLELPLYFIGAALSGIWSGEQLALTDIIFSKFTLYLYGLVALGDFIAHKITGLK